MRRPTGEEGQVFPALLLVVVMLLFAGLAIGQLGSASDQRVQTQTATDAGAVAAAQQMLATVVLASPSVLPPGLAKKIALTGSLVPPAAAACTAANRNRTANGKPAVDCAASLSVQTVGNAARVALTAPAGEIVSGPAADTSATRADATAVAEVVFRRCPSGYSGLADRILGALVDETAAQLGQPDPHCGPGAGPGLEPSPLPAPSGAPVPLPSPPDLTRLPDGAAAFDVVDSSFRTQIVD